jgi:hypothetical protein
MNPDARRQKRRDFALSSLNVAIEASNLAKEFCSITPAKPIFGSFSIILTLIRVDFYVICVDRSGVNGTYAGVDDQRGLCRTWAGLWLECQSKGPRFGPDHVQGSLEGPRLVRTEHHAFFAPKRHLVRKKSYLQGLRPRIWSGLLIRPCHLLSDYP